MEPKIASETDKDRLEQISPDHSVEAVEIEKLDPTKEILPGPGPIKHEVSNDEVVVVGDLPEGETANSVSSIIESGTEKVIPLPESDRAAAINDVIFKPASEFKPDEATDIANGQSAPSEE